jgi:hypothetical protein
MGRKRVFWFFASIVSRNSCENNCSSRSVLLSLCIASSWWVDPLDKSVTVLLFKFKSRSLLVVFDGAGSQRIDFILWSKLILSFLLVHGLSPTQTCLIDNIQLPTNKASHNPVLLALSSSATTLCPITSTALRPSSSYHIKPQPIPRPPHQPPFPTSTAPTHPHPTYTPNVTIHPRS